MLVFIDESGYPIPSDSTVCPLLVAVCIMENDLREFIKQVHQLKESAIGKDVELKATSMVVDRTLTKNRTQNKACVDGLVEIAVSLKLGVFAVIMDKPNFTPKQVPGILPPQFRFLLDRVNKWSYKWDSNAIIIFDTRQDSKDLSEAFYGYLYKSPFGRELHNILELPLFVDSGTTPGIQLADIIAGIIRHQEEIRKGVLHDERFITWIEQLYGKVTAMSFDFPKDHGKDYGLYRMPTYFFVDPNATTEVPEVTKTLDEIHSA